MFLLAGYNRFMAGSDNFHAEKNRERRNRARLPGIGGQFKTAAASKADAAHR